MSEIDIVLAWVDGGDPAWQKEKALYDGKGADDRAERYRDWDNLQYLFRGIDQFMPWVRTVHFVTWGHLPQWMNTECKRLHIVKHSDYIPAEYLPTFNANPIEMNFHRIPGLAEHFIYMNDDMFVLKPLKETDFFRDGKPLDMLALQPVVANPKSPAMSHIYLNNALVLSKYFQKRENIKQHPGNYFHIGYPMLYFCYNFLELAFPLFSGLYTSHSASALCKSTYEELWDKEYDVLHATSQHKFRDDADVNQYLLREWQKLSNRFVPVNMHRNFQYFNVESHNPKLLNVIQKQKISMICINDANTPIDFEAAKKEIKDAFEMILPNKSSFEK